MKIGYVRVSTEEQNLDLQREALGAAGCERIFEDWGVSAARHLGENEGWAAIGASARKKAWAPVKVTPEKLAHAQKMIAGGQEIVSGMAALLGPGEGSNP